MYLLKQCSSYLRKGTGGGGRKPTYESVGGTRRVVPREAVLSERLNKDGISKVTSHKIQPTEGIIMLPYYCIYSDLNFT